MNYSDVDDVLTTIEIKVIDVLTEEQKTYFAKNMNDILTKRGLLDQSASETLSDRIDAIINRSHEPLSVCDYEKAAEKANRSKKTIERYANRGVLRNIKVNGRLHVFEEDLKVYIDEKSSNRKPARKLERMKREEFINNYFANNDTVIAGDLADLLHDNCDYSNTDNPRSSAFSTIRDRVNNGTFVNLTKLDEERAVTREDTIALAGYKPQQQLSLSTLQQDYEDIFTAW